MTLRILIAMIAATLPVQVAKAQDGDPSGPATQGGRVELLMGYQTDGADSALLYGARVGYDFKVGRSLLLGVDGEVNDITAERSIFSGPQNATVTVTDGPDFYVGGRVSFALSNRFRVYGMGGYSHARLGSFFFNLPTASVTGKESFESGYRVGAGAQLSLGRRVFLGGEYRYSDYGSERFPKDQFVGSVGLRF